ncbi:MAG: hypothetical protein VW715_07090 [Rhodospirillales bacterium]|jgi:hypothetical protein
MTTAEAGDVFHALTYCFSFYRKPFEPIDKQVWGSVMRDNSYTSQQWQDAIRSYMSRGKFAPKPYEMLEILSEQSESRKMTRLSEPTQIQDTCPPDIRDAWMYWLPKFHDQPLPFVSNRLEGDVADEQAEEWLLLVNKEAWKANTPEAVPEPFRLKEIWGG